MSTGAFISLRFINHSLFWEHKIRENSFGIELTGNKMIIRKKSSGKSAHTDKSNGFYGIFIIFFLFPLHFLPLYFNPSTH
ncbi:MAG: hypothetical protein EA359_07030 [Balneolaceae bacterium]|nr:MAG: hypothetical protein EA359_07030 [Balneolaceae bacterium]